jgi:hypothetical protein
MTKPSSSAKGSPSPSDDGSRFSCSDDTMGSDRNFITTSTHPFSKKFLPDEFVRWYVSAGIEGCKKANLSIKRYLVLMISASWKTDREEGNTFECIHDFLLNDAPTAVKTIISTFVPNFRKRVHKHQAAFQEDCNPENEENWNPHGYIPTFTETQPLMDLGEHLEREYPGFCNVMRCIRRFLFWYSQNSSEDGHPVESKESINKLNDLLTEYFDDGLLPDNIKLPQISASSVNGAAMFHPKNIPESPSHIKRMD